jgi:hypothetical protein
VRLSAHYNPSRSSELNWGGMSKRTPLTGGLPDADTGKSTCPCHPLFLFRPMIHPTAGGMGKRTRLPVVLGPRHGQEYFPMPPPFALDLPMGDMLTYTYS